LIFSRKAFAGYARSFVVC